MPVNIYKNACPDFYPKTPAASDCSRQIQRLASTSKYLYVDEEKGIKLVGLLVKIWETIKGFFGFDNHTNPILIGSETLKLLHYCQTHGHLSNTEVKKSLKSVKNAIDKKKVALSKSFNKTIKSLYVKGTLDTSANLQKKLVAFHKKYEDELSPSFWNRLLIAPEIPASDDAPFGSTSLRLAIQAATGSTPTTPLRSMLQSIEEVIYGEQDESEKKQMATEEALKQFRYAIESNNHSQAFQLSLRTQFKHFVERLWMGGADGESWSKTSAVPKKNVLALIQSLTSIVFRNNQDLEAEQYATFGLAYFPKNLSLRTIRCETQVKQAKYNEAYQDRDALEQWAEDLELKLTLAESAAGKTDLQAELKRIYSHLGEIYCRYAKTEGWLIKSTSSPDYKHASAYFLKAWQIDSTDVEIEAKLFNTLMAAAENEMKSIGFWGKLFSVFKFWSEPASNDKSHEFVEKASKCINNIKMADLQRLISLLEKQKQYEKAIHFYEFGIRKWPKAETPFVLKAETYYQNGLAQEGANKLQEAYEIMEKGSKLDPHHPKIPAALFALGKQLGEKYLTSNDPKAAYHYFKQALVHQPKAKQGKEVHHCLRDLCASFAKEAVNKCLLDHPDYPQEDWKKHKEKVAEHLKTALKWYNEAISHDPKNGRIHFDKAELLNFFEMSNDDEDFAEYKLAVEGSSNNYFYLLRLSESYGDKHDQHFYQHYQDLATQLRQGAALDYLHWFDDRFLKNETYHINPHTF